MSSPTSAVPPAADAAARAELFARLVPGLDPCRLRFWMAACGRLTGRHLDFWARVEAFARGEVSSPAADAPTADAALACAADPLEAARSFAADFRSPGSAADKLRLFRELFGPRPGDGGEGHPPEVR